MHPPLGLFAQPVTRKPSQSVLYRPHTAAPVVQGREAERASLGRCLRPRGWSVAQPALVFAQHARGEPRRASRPVDSAGTCRLWPSTPTPTLRQPPSPPCGRRRRNVPPAGLPWAARAGGRRGAMARPVDH
eukprot:363481-Chlamydomonas_euryale.AAC.8